MPEGDNRPNPDELLARVKIEEEKQKHGRLKVFLGYAAGVGKTYAMLEAARQRMKEMDIAIAYVETHGRAETEALLEGLKTIPSKQVEYRGVKFTEMDIDAVLVRRPQIALVDELAHTNAPGSRHPKRYQDVEDLLEAGIDVYTTLNIQHIESLRNVVAQITGIWIRETVPDSIVDKATEIELVDLPPDELLNRLKEGKVYVHAQIVPATENFFRPGNLSALRELTMRTAAEHVDEQMRAYMETHAIRGPWPTADRVLVSVSPGSFGSRLVRAARRFASQMDAEWIVMYVETPDNIRLPPDEQDRLIHTLRLAERLGAKTVKVHGHSVAAAVVDYARKNNIARIVVGRPKPVGLRRFINNSVANQIIRQSTEMDVYVVSGTGEPVAAHTRTPQSIPTNWGGYLMGLGLVALATLLGILLRQFFTPTNLIMIYLLCVVITAIWWGPGPSILVSIVSVITFDLFIVPPILTLRVSDTEYILTFIALLVVGLTISYLTSRTRRQTEALQRRESQTEALYALSRDLAVSNDLDSYINSIITRTRETFGYDSVIFLPDVRNNGKLKPYTNGLEIAINDKESATASWSFEHRRAAGHGTDTLPDVNGRYLPLMTSRGTVGVMALWINDALKNLSLEEERLLLAYADLAATAIERVRLAEEARNSQMLEATGRLQTALLNSISHDLRTPLVTIVGVLSSMQEDGMHLDDAAEQNLIQVARSEADRLNRLITNLLDITRMEAGTIKLLMQRSEVQDLIGAALEQFGHSLGERRIKIDVPPGLPFVMVDFSLAVQALFNILDNAVKYSPPDAPIEITARQLDQQVEIVVADKGIGIPPEDLSRVFQKFYRVQRPDNVSGTGLGLSICKGIVEAHGGHISAESRPGGGTIIRLTLPAAAIQNGKE